LIVSEYVSNSFSLTHNLTHEHTRELESTCLQYPVKQGRYSTCHDATHLNTTVLNSTHKACVGGSNPPVATLKPYTIP
ncbi:MAG: hypothetical protein V3R67_07110, partial [Thermodesulfobacteriota bacterium]